MSRHPVAHDCAELSNLNIDPRIIQWRVAQQIFVEPHLHAFVGGIEPAIGPRLDKEFKVRGEVGVEKKSQTRIKKKIVISVDEPGRWLIQVVTLEVKQAADLQIESVVGAVDRQCVLELLERIGCPNGRGPGYEQKRKYPFTNQEALRYSVRPHGEGSRLFFGAR